MRRLFRLVAIGCLWFACGAGGPSSAAAQEAAEAPAQRLDAIQPGGGVPRATFATPNGATHVLRSVTGRAAANLAGADNGPLVYHAGGSVMQSPITIYPIFWGPTALQNGSVPSYSASYPKLQAVTATFYGGHGLASNNTQYYQTINGTTTYVQGFVVGNQPYIDTGAFPASGCNNSGTGINCVNDAQMQAEITRVMNLNGWTGGLNHLFVLFLPSGEGTCMDSSATSCSNNFPSSGYCGYHGFISGATPVIYAIMPYAEVNGCQISGTPSPNGDAAADAETTVLTHEITEAITDPLLNAWYTAQGNEIGDLCATYVASSMYGTNTWTGPSGAANQMWNGWFLEVQQEWDNHTSGCVQRGP